MRTHTVAPRHPDHSNAERNETTNRLLRQAARASEPERQRLIHEVIILNLRLAESIAKRYSGRGLERDDLVQVANLGLVNAAQRFNPDLGKDFVSFAVPTISGQVKRYFRDHGWSVRPPRRVQEMHATISNASSDIAQRLGNSPRSAEIADYLGVDVSDVIEARASHDCFTATSLDDRGNSGDDAPLSSSLGEEDGGFDRAEALVTLAPVCRRLQPLDRKILFLRFFRGWTQQEIARELGVTQMQVSRLLTRILENMRRDLGIAQARKPGHKTRNGSSVATQVVGRP